VANEGRGQNAHEFCRRRGDILQMCDIAAEPKYCLLLIARSEAWRHGVE
jgi:hypothetical protein